MPTKASIVQLALTLMAERGESLTMSDIAEEAGVTLQSLVSDFPTKEDFILAVYNRVAIQLEARISEIPPGTVAARTACMARWKIQMLAPYRKAFSRLAWKLATTTGRAGVFSPHTLHFKVLTTSMLARCCAEASPAPQPGNVNSLVRLLYAGHLVIIWVGLHSPFLAEVGLRLFSRIPLAPSSRTGQAVVSWMIKATDTITGRISPSLVQPSDSLAESIFQRVLIRRRFNSATESCAHTPCHACAAPHLPKIQSFIANGAPVHFVLPAFPAKSPSPQKVLGTLPDLGETIALTSLQALCDEIKTIYPPGAKITICSDGHVFSDLVEVSDDEVSSYSAALRAMAVERGFTSIEFFELRDLSGATGEYPRARQELMRDFGETEEQIRERTEKYPHHRALFDGIHRFIFEDRIVLHPDISKTQNRTIAKTIAYQVIARSNAWSRLIAEQFPFAVRLSIHPQQPHSEKIGIALCPSVDNWITPWHGAILLEKKSFALVKRADAESTGALVIYTEGRASHLERIS
jgi:pyoverdine/dityrosine biosynthesis protein Dit1/AcrR family transcriptional regulator